MKQTEGKLEQASAVFGKMLMCVFWHQDIECPTLFYEKMIQSSGGL